MSRIISFLVRNLNCHCRSREPKYIQPISRFSLRKYSLSPELQRRAIIAHLAAHRKTIPASGLPRMFVVVHHVNWERPALVDAWSGLCDVAAAYDWEIEEFDQYAPDWFSTKKKEFNDRLLLHVQNTHSKGAINIFFSYLSGRWVFPETIEKINRMGIITINIGFDDTISFWNSMQAGHYTGNADLARVYDISITCQNYDDVAKYHYCGGRPLFMFPGCVPSLVPFTDHDKSPVITFIGQAYGARIDYIDSLRAAGLPVQAWGKGWKDGALAIGDMYEKQSKSLINLGLGYVSTSKKIMGVKGRDFEAPLTGGLYLTTYHRDLLKAYIPNKEIVLYRTKKELIEYARHYIGHPDEAKKIGAAGRARCLAEHTWQARFRAILELLRGNVAS